MVFQQAYKRENIAGRQTVIVDDGSCNSLNKTSTWHFTHFELHILLKNSARWLRIWFHTKCVSTPFFYPSVFRHSEPVKYFLQSKNNFIHSAVFFFCPDAVKKFHHDRKIFMAFFLTLIGANKDEVASAFRKKKDEDACRFMVIVFLLPYILS